MIIKTKSSEHKLYILATPIGNLKEITFRAIEAMKDTTCIFCEDTRVTNKLLAHLQINNKKLISYQKFNEKEKLNEVLNLIFKNQCMLVSDAGYPCISDPGYNLVDACYKHNIGIEVINGPSSLIHSLVVSGININNFYFNGFLNANKTQRINRLKDLKHMREPIIFFESVHRIKQCLSDINEIINPINFIVCRELTKINETIYRGKYDEIINEIIEKGEFVVIVEPGTPKKEIISNDKYVQQVMELVDLDGIKLKQACKNIAKKYDLLASDLYFQCLAFKK